MGQLNDDIYINGHLRAKTMQVPSSAIVNASVSTSAGITAEKLWHEHRQVHSQPNAAATAETRVLHVVRGATGTILQLEAGSIAKAVGDSTVTIDLHKSTSGAVAATVLSSPIVLDSTNANYTPEVAPLNDDALVDGDVLVLVITISAGTGTPPTGVYAALSVREDGA